MAELFIADGFTLTKTIDGVAGLYPKVYLEYRPALPKEQLVYAAKLESKNPDAIENYVVELVAKHTVKINDEPLPKDKVKALNPVIRNRLVDLILSYTAADEAKDEGN